MDASVVAEALDACEYGRAWGLVVEAARAGAPLPIGAVAPIFRGLEQPEQVAAIFTCTSGDRAAVMLDLAERPPFRGSLGSGDLRALALYLAWKIGDRAAIRRRILVQARRLARVGAGGLGLALVVAIGRDLSDEHLDTLLEDWRDLEGDLDGFVVEVERWLRIPPRELPTQAPENERAVASGFTVRTGPKVGRNDPCPCGSGKKFKKCCADKAVFSPSPIAGLSWDDYLRTAGDRMSFEDLYGISDRDLMRIDVKQLRGKAVVAALRRFSGLKLWDRAEAALECFPAEDRDAWREELIHDLLEDKQLERARAQSARMENVDDLMIGDLLALEMPATLERLLEWAGKAVRDENQAVDLAYALLDHAPALGILITEGVLNEERPADAWTLREAADDARDQLLLPPRPPDWDALAPDEDEDHDEEDDDEEDDDDGHAERERLQRHLQASEARVRQLEQQLRARTPQTAAVTAPPPPPDESQRAKIAELKAIIRERNQERAELRRQLAEAPLSSSGARAVPEEADDDRSEPAAAPRGILLPRFSTRAAESLSSLPQTVSRGALRTLGALAAAEPAAWRSVKQAKDMGRPLYMTRIGIHHRLLFHADDGVLEVLDLVAREGLDLTLKRLRAR